MGLTAAFTVFLTVAIQCWYDFSYNGGLKNTDDVYLFTHNSGNNDRWSSNIGIYSRFNELNQIKQAYSGIDICAVLNWGNSGHLYFSIIGEDGVETRFDGNGKIGVTSDFLSIFNPETIAGDATKLFTEPNKTVITKSYAKKFFGDENPVGKTIKAGNLYRQDSEPILSVIAVWEDFPDNCSLKNGVYYDIGDDREQDGCDAVFMKIKKNGKSALETLVKQITRGEHWPKEKQEHLQDLFNSRKINLIPFDKIHFSILGGGNLTTTLSLLFVGIIALLIAYINFVNFSISMAPARVKSLNIQKIFGASNRILRLIAGSESAVFSLIAFLFAMFFVEIIHKNWVSGFFAVSMSLGDNLQILMVSGGFAVLLGFVVGLYPAYYVTSFKPVLTLSGSPVKSKKNMKLRNILASIQFTVAIALIIVVVFLKQQYNYAINYSYKMDAKNIICLSTGYWEDDKVKSPELVYAFTEELKKSPQILDYATTSSLIGAGNYSGKITFNDKEFDCSFHRIGSDLFRILDIPVIAGIEFYNSTSPKRSVMVNRKFVEACGMSVSEIVGKTTDGGGTTGGKTVIGVIDNINFENLHHPVQPIVFTCEDNAYKFYDPWLLIKLANQNPETMKYLKSVWENFSKKPFEPKFLDSYLTGLYERENNLAKLLTIICIIAIIIAIMGVYGLITFNIRQKEKEIALRKIAGATVWDVLLLLNRGALIQLIIAFVVAAPVAYYITNRWLETFAYKISIHWWVFVLCWLFMCIITLATICIQTYRAATQNPIEALKTE
jgi:putative ABC transport system permease protein